MILSIFRYYLFIFYYIYALVQRKERYLFMYTTLKQKLNVTTN